MYNVNWAHMSRVDWIWLSEWVYSVPNKTVVDSDWHFDNLRRSHFWTQNKLHNYSASQGQHDLENNTKNNNPPISLKRGLC